MTTTVKHWVEYQTIKDYDNGTWTRSPVGGNYPAVRQFAVKVSAVHVKVRIVTETITTQFEEV